MSINLKIQQLHNKCKMTFLSRQKELQASFYTHLTRESSKADSLPNTKVLLRHVKSVHDSATQILNEFGTTDTVIGDATAEIMITTLGKIPNEMYYLEDTTLSGKATKLHTVLNNYNLSVGITLVPTETDKSDGYTGRSTLLLILLSLLLIILLLCCITACIIAKSRSRHSFFTKSDIECSPGCSGVNVPLLGLEKTSDTTTKTSSIKN
ncbi:uncharacterized protein LOC105184419 isoform X2 [Harpegnathos saltator]|uniref:uncharacterized protein LOC105184419 isoform X2 n=1 Tax=Harpegnathos saltator TaxID=610380 RepID=UPI000DBEE020|nr:uncharacterized protein LOC105184419 isoform X2 [Harpegnathos saltator]